MMFPRFSLFFKFFFIQLHILFFKQAFILKYLRLLLVQFDPIGVIFVRWWSLVSTIRIFANSFTFLLLALLQELFKPLPFFLLEFVVSHGEFCIVHRNRFVILRIFAHSSQLFLFLFQTSHIIVKFFLHFFVCCRCRLYPSCFLEILILLFYSVFRGSLTLSQRHLVF